jgi:hypothetical protein
MVSICDIEDVNVVLNESQKTIINKFKIAYKTALEENIKKEDEFIDYEDRNIFYGDKYFNNRSMVEITFKNGDTIIRPNSTIFMSGIKFMIEYRYNDNVIAFIYKDGTVEKPNPKLSEEQFKKVRCLHYTENDTKIKIFYKDGSNEVKRVKND